MACNNCMTFEKSRELAQKCANELNVDFVVYKKGQGWDYCQPIYIPNTYKHETNVLIKPEIKEAVKPTKKPKVVNAD